jgi:hypothetical protein
LLTDQQQGTSILREMPSGLRRAPDIDWARVPAKTAIHLFFGQGVHHPSRWRLLLAAGVLGTNGLEPATIIVAIACAKGVPLELQSRFGPQAIAAVSNPQ